MTELLIAVESAENIAELIEAGTLSSHMKSIAATLRKIIEETGPGGYVLLKGKPTILIYCACGCGRLLPVRKKKPRKFYNGACRARHLRTQRGHPPIHDKGEWA